jgi:hypothetical protein
MVDAYVRYSGIGLTHCIGVLVHMEVAWIELSWCGVFVSLGPLVSNGVY